MNNVDGFVVRIIQTTTCSKHDAKRDVACFSLPPGDTVDSPWDRFLGVCNQRAKKAGYVGTINPNSLRRGAPVTTPSRKTRKK